MKSAKGVMEEVCGCVYALLNGTTQTDWSLTAAMFAKNSFNSDLFNFQLDLLKDKTVDYCDKVIQKYTAD